MRTSIYYLVIGTLLITSCSGARLYFLVEDTDIFKHSVASGDPTSTSVIIWTRLSGFEEPTTVKWQISKRQDFASLGGEGMYRTSAEQDYTVKIDVPDLDPGTFYYYRFIIGKKVSQLGRTKTLSDTDQESVKLGIVSCSNYEFGYFGAYHGLAEEELDAILHLGDYIYEYGPDKYGDKAFTRKHLPAHEIISLEDYRTRYGQYREDEGLQQAHQMHPFITIWDDHEIANDSYKDGAQNHQEDEGDYQTRKQIAKQVYYEWMPVRPQKNAELYRSFTMGDLVDVIMLDERYTGREAPTESLEEADTERSMLGSTQLSWLKNELATSTAKWKVIGNQVIFSPCDLSAVRPDFPLNLDAWDGYAYERDDIRTFLADHNISDVVFVTGDTHSSWAFDIPKVGTNYSDDKLTCGVEIGTPSITSSNWNEREGVTDDVVRIGERAMISQVPHLKYVNGRDHGYTILTLGKEEGSAKWYYLDDMKVKKPNMSLVHEVAFQANKIK